MRLSSAPLSPVRLSLCLLLAALPSKATELIPTVLPIPTAWIGGHYCSVWNIDAPYVVVLFHGYLSQVEDYYPLARRFADLGYATVVPEDCDGTEALGCAASWGKNVAAAVRDWAGTRPVAAVGHSMGGGAVMSAAKFTPGIAAFVAMHPAPIVSGVSWATVRGPILFTTGTYDDGTFGGTTLGATAPDRALVAYNDADLPKALVNVKGDIHTSSVTSHGDEWQAVTNWLGCFLRRQEENCEWVRTKMCTSANLEWCYHFGVQQAMYAMQSLHV